MLGVGSVYADESASNINADSQANPPQIQQLTQEEIELQRLKNYLDSLTLTTDLKVKLQSLPPEVLVQMSKLHVNCQMVFTKYYNYLRNSYARQITSTDGKKLDEVLTKNLTSKEAARKNKDQFDEMVTIINPEEKLDESFLGSQFFSYELELMQQISQQPSMEQGLTCYLMMRKDQISKFVKKEKERQEKELQQKLKNNVEPNQQKQ